MSAHRSEPSDKLSPRRYELSRPEDLPTMDASDPRPGQRIVDDPLLTSAVTMGASVALGALIHFAPAPFSLSVSPGHRRSDDAGVLPLAR